MGTTLNTVATKRAGHRKGRPNYPRPFKLEVAIAACDPGVSVSKLALSHGLNTSQVFKWRRDYLAGRLGESGSAVLVPVSVPDDMTVMDSGTIVAQRESSGGSDAVATGNIEIVISGALVRLNGTVDASQLRLVLRCLKTS